MCNVQYFCQVCGDGMTGNDGCICIDRWAAIEEMHKRDRREYEQRVNNDGDLGNLMPLIWDMEEIPWMIHHYRCGNHDGHYDFNVGDLRTQADVLERTCHVMQKGWFDTTDWDDVILTGAAKRVVRRRS